MCYIKSRGLFIPIFWYNAEIVYTSANHNAAITYTKYWNFREHMQSAIIRPSEKIAAHVIRIMKRPLFVAIGEDNLNKIMYYKL